MSEWSSCEQALADVACATHVDGYGRRPPNHVDNTCIVHGAAKPKRRVVHEGDELELHFGRVKGEGGALPPPPDLPGITRLLRMTDNIDEVEDGSGGDASVVIVKPKPGSGNRAEPAALDPSVAEFVPRRAPSPPPPPTDEALAFLWLRVYESRGQDDEDAFRRNKYAAIANMLRAGATAASTPAPTASPPALRTPDYFLSAGGAGDPDVRLSIEKVSNWFEHKPRPPPPLAPAPHLGPVAFKRKERVAHPPGGPLERKTQRAVPSAGSYVPSPYAAELSARWEAREEAPPAALGMWQRLERDLRRRDDELRRRARGEPLPPTPTD